MPISLDPLSFALGVVAGILAWVLLGSLRQAFREWRQAWNDRRQQARAQRASNLEEEYRRLVLRRAQGMHLAAPLFALDEILIPPRLIAPPPRVEPGGPLPPDDILTQTLPYLPAWPEVATIYNAPTLTLPQALSGGRHLVLLGPPGWGKTVALAHLATLAARKDPQLGPLVEFIPLLFHVADLPLPLKEGQSPLEPLIAAISEQASPIQASRAASLLQQTFQNHRALLLVDGFDELPPDGQQAVKEFLQTLLKAYPHTRVVTTALPDQIDGLRELGFAPLALAGWTSWQQTEFLRTWADRWTRFIAPEAWVQVHHPLVDPLLLQAWLSVGNQHLTPLELTLKLWVGFAGDMLGGFNVQDWIAAHLRRLAPLDIPPAALEVLALQAIQNTQPIFETQQARQWVRTFEPIPSEDPSGSSQPAESAKKTEGGLRLATPDMVEKMVLRGLLVRHGDQRLRFAHPILPGYLAGRALSAYGGVETVAQQPDWIGKHLSLHYLAVYGDPSPAVTLLLQSQEPLFHRPLLRIARWLRHTPQQSPWRGQVLAALAHLFRSPGQPLGLLGQVMAALALSGDPGVRALFRQSMQTSSSDLVVLAALGSGLLRDGKAIELLTTLLSSEHLTARRAACLALVAIGTPPALEAIGRALLTGDDDLRRAAAEALANDRNEGYATLKDGATFDDLLVRRAVVYGLARVDEPWALEILQNMQIHDQQWIVRSAATQVLETRANQNELRIPRPLTPPWRSEWLIEFAGRQGRGLSPGSPATDVLLQALKEGTRDERLAALEYLRFLNDETVILSLLDALQDNATEIRETAYLVLWEMAASDVPIPATPKPH